MQHKEKWIPTKFVYEKGKWRGSRNPQHLAVFSRLGIERISDFYAKACAEHAKGLLLDLGCGKVPFYGMYKDHIDDVICVDWAEVVQENPFLDQICDLNKPLPFENETFDTILMSDVLEHIRYPEALMKEIGRILKKEGKLLMNVPFFYSLHDEPHDYFRYTRHALRGFCEEANLQVFYLEAGGGVPEILSDIFSKNVIIVPYIGKYLCLMFQFWAKLALKLPFVQKVSEKTGYRFPFAYFLIAEKK